MATKLFEGRNQKLIKRLIILVHYNKYGWMILDVEPKKMKQIRVWNPNQVKLGFPGDNFVNFKIMLSLSGLVNAKKVSLLCKFD